MEAEQVLKVVKKLIGPIEPVGESNTDTERTENLEQFLKLYDEIDSIVNDIAWDYKDRHEASVKKMVKMCTKALQDKNE